MTYDMYRYIFIIGAILAGVMLAVSVLLFFVLKIPVVIGDLNGANARKGIESIRSKAQTSSGGGTYKARSTSGRKTESFASKRLQRHEDGSRNTAKISSSAPIINETTVLGQTAAETTLLEQPTANETTVLDASSVMPQSAASVPTEPSPLSAMPIAFEIEYDITFIHTDEMIA